MFYCGGPISDDATVCAIDGQPLPDNVKFGKGHRRLARVLWVWGTQQLAGMGRLPLHSSSNRAGRHNSPVRLPRGSAGMPGTGYVDGIIRRQLLSFSKADAVVIFIGPGGSLTTYREYVLFKRSSMNHDLPPAPIFYRGKLSDTKRVERHWMIDRQPIPCRATSRLNIAREYGFWCAEFITDESQR